MRVRSLTFGAVLIAAFPFSLGCEESVQDEQQDVQDARIEAEKDVMEEKQDVNEAVREGQQNIEEEKADLREAELDKAQDAAAENPN